MTDFYDDEWDGDDYRDEDLPEPDDLSPEQERINYLVEEYGYSSPDDFVRALNDVDAGEIRGDRFADFADALNFLDSIGILGFSFLIWFEEEGLWGYVVDYPEKA